MALRLSPKDSWVGTAALSLAMAAFVEKESTGFEDWAGKAIQAQPYAPIRRALMVAYAAEAGDEKLLTIHLDSKRWQDTTLEETMSGTQLSFY